MFPFQFGQEYPRSALLDFVGSKQQQAGVLWGIKSPDCLIITSGGRHGKKVGYSDERLSDGSWLYFGQGLKGDHLFTNAANAKLSAGRQTVLLFSTREPTAAEVRQRGNYQKLFAFQGAFNVCSHETFIPPAGPRAGDHLLRFLLVPVAALSFATSDDEAPHIRFDLLRDRVTTYARGAIAATSVSIAQYRYRSDLVKQYALLRAGGKCEACGGDPPFVDEYGNGFLEVHHIHRLADDGIDAAENVAAICPNCHRRAHYSGDRKAFNGSLVEIVRNRESELSLLARMDKQVEALDQS